MQAAGRSPAASHIGRRCSDQSSFALIVRMGTATRSEGAISYRDTVSLQDKHSDTKKDSRHVCG